MRKLPLQTVVRAMASSRGQNNGRIRMQDLVIAEDVKISIERALKLFLGDDSTTGNRPDEYVTSFG
jgi:hypothetical protein